MSKFDDVYGGKWLKAGDLDDKKHKLQIEGAEWQEVGPEKQDKLILAFIDQSKSFILNATNANALGEKWGKAQAAWVGRWVEASPVETAFGPGIRLKPIEAPIATADIPF